LTPGRNEAKDIDLPIRSADELVRYNKDDGMFDVSYAAAWELGRLLTLQKTRVAVDLFNWKRAHAHEEHLQTAERFLAHLPYERAKTDLELPQTVTTWFADLALLHGVPFSYLVPDERMLPLESIRFFVWISDGLSACWMAPLVLGGPCSWSINGIRTMPPAMPKVLSETRTKW
jgi:hypothetical protein